MEHQRGTTVGIITRIIMNETKRKVEDSVNKLTKDRQKSDILQSKQSKTSLRNNKAVLFRRFIRPEEAKAFSWAVLLK